MDITVQIAIDSAESNFGIPDSDTTYQGYLLNKFNQEIFPRIRNEILKIDGNFFSEIGYADIVADQDIYRPTKDRDKTAYAGGTKNIRKLQALGVLFQAGSNFYRPVSNAVLFRDERAQVDTSTTANVWGYLMEGKYVRVLDIPREAKTNGLRFDYTPEYQSLVIGDEIPLLNDLAGIVISGLSLRLAQRMRITEQIRLFTGEWELGIRDVRKFAFHRVDMDTNLDNQF